LRNDQITRATVNINFRGVRQSFTTENTKQRHSLMTLRLIDGPFRKLEGTWQFLDLGGQGCKIELRLQYEFTNVVLEKLVGPVFSYIANSLVEAFVQRAQQVYGK
jgi:ribosome-associated toxin RatA of RatAB toxin-antitoxin module